MAVTNRLSEIGKKSVKDEKERQKVDIQMRQMEAAAQKAYEADIARGGDLTTQAINAMVAATAAEAEEQSSVSSNQAVPGPSAIPRRAIDPMLPPVDVLEDEERAKREKMRKKVGTAAFQARDQSMWVEAKSDEGHTYYWNVKSGGKSIQQNQLVIPF